MGACYGELGGGLLQVLIGDDGVAAIHDRGPVHQFPVEGYSGDFASSRSFSFRSVRITRPKPLLVMFSHREHLSVSGCVPGSP